jgi:hypothetical protein
MQSYHCSRLDEYPIHCNEHAFFAPKTLCGRVSSDMIHCFVLPRIPSTGKFAFLSDLIFRIDCFYCIRPLSHSQRQRDFLFDAAQRNYADTSQVRALSQTLRDKS